jgi:hypothetical protein
MFPRPPRTGSGGGKELRYGVGERRYALSDDLPREIDVDVEVAVNQHVAKSRDTSPINLRELCAQICRDVLGCFTDDLEVANDVDHHLIIAKVSNVRSAV